MVFEYKIIFWICVLVLWIHLGYCIVKKLLWNVRIKAFWYTKYIIFFFIRFGTAQCFPKLDDYLIFLLIKYLLSICVVRVWIITVYFVLKPGFNCDIIDCYHTNPFNIKLNNIFEIQYLYLDAVNHNYCLSLIKMRKC